MTKPLVSAIVPTRNRAGSLRNALDSIYAQQGSGREFDLEVIVVDDASTDNTPDVVGRYPSARYLRLARQRGSKTAMNAGLRASSGRYVAFLDDDDEWLPHKLAVQVPRLEANHGLGAVYSQLRVRYGDKEWLQPAADRAPSGWVFADMLMENCCGGSLLIRRAVFDKAGGFDESFASYADYDMWLRIAFHFPVQFIPGPAQIYNLSDDGQWLTAARNGTGDRDRVRAAERALRLLPESPDSAELRQRVRVRARLGSMSPFVMTGQFARVWSKLLVMAVEDPSIARHAVAHGHLNWAISTMIAAATSPAGITRDLQRQLHWALRETSAGTRRSARPAQAAIWAQMACALAAHPDGNDREAAGAAARALLYAPAERPGMTLRLIARGLLGRRAYTGIKRLVQRAALARRSAAVLVRKVQPGSVLRARR